MKACILTGSEGVNYCKLVNFWKNICSNFLDFPVFNITKTTFDQKIDEIIAAQYDFIINLAFEDLEMLQLFEAKNLPLIGPNYAFMKKTPLEIKDILNKNGFFVPDEIKTIECEFPIVLKEFSIKSRKLITKFISNKSQLNEFPQSQNLESEFMFEKFIEGEVYEVLVYESEFENGLVAVGPIQKRGEENNKNLIKDYEKLGRIKKIGIEAFDSLGIRGSGYGRVKICIDKDEKFFILGVDQYPDPSSVQIGDDVILNSIIGAKKYDFGLSNSYDGVSSVYEEKFFRAQPQKIFTFFIQNFDYSGTLLDLGCGPGIFGKMASFEHQVVSTGVDISPQMCELALKNGYVKTHVGLIENSIVEIGKNFVAFGALHFLTTMALKKTLSKMFEMSRKSISVSNEEFPPIYTEVMKIKVPNLPLSRNHSQIFDEFILPAGWKIAYKEKKVLWDSPISGIQISGNIIRYERN